MGGILYEIVDITEILPPTDFDHGAIIRDLWVRIVPFAELKADGPECIVATSVPFVRL